MKDKSKLPKRVNYDSPLCWQIFKVTESKLFGLSKTNVIGIGISHDRIFFLDEAVKQGWQTLYTKDLKKDKEHPRVLLFDNEKKKPIWKKPSELTEDDKNNLRKIQKLYKDRYGTIENFCEQFYNAFHKRNTHIPTLSLQQRAEYSTAFGMGNLSGKVSLEIYGAPDPSKGPRSRL